MGSGGDDDDVAVLGARRRMLDQFKWPLADSCSGSWDCFGVLPNTKSTSSIQTSESSSSSEDADLARGDGTGGNAPFTASTSLSRFYNNARSTTCSSPDYMMCANPCTTLGRGRVQETTGTLGITPLNAPDTEQELTTTAQTARDRRIERYQRKQEQTQQRLEQENNNFRTHEDIEVLPDNKVQVRLPPTNHPDYTAFSSPAPLESLEIKANMVELERSVSELTMRSSDAYPNTRLSPDNRRMAFYAVGPKSRGQLGGGNRRCYFTGKVILGGVPYYAGCLQQGMRTLVVFCLPSALGLPKKEEVKQSALVGQDRPSQRLLTGILGSRVGKQDNKSRPGSIWSGASVASKSHRSKSRLSSLDDLSQSREGDVDCNWNLDAEHLLNVLPKADSELLDQMRFLYPDQFETLPLPIRDHGVWNLYAHFCFFSGLPISNDELYYKVRDEDADQIWGEEVILSHNVMEAAHGDSLDLIQLPNQQTFRYLKKQYTQQCLKLNEKVFRRVCWERIVPEV